jgi:hypothetical protein
VTALLPLVFSSGWASGVNSYATVLLLGLLGRFAGVDAVPAGLQRTDVLIAAAVLYAAEFVADKIPYVDSTWDAVHTVIRPAVGTAIGLLVAGDATTLDQAVLGATGGTTALASHLVKAGLRLAVNTSPEPASNIGVSRLEDFSVAGVVGLAVAAPWVAAGVAAVLLAVGVVVVVRLAKRIRRTRGRWREWRASRA